MKYDTRRFLIFFTLPIHPTKRGQFCSSTARTITPADGRGRTRIAALDDAAAAAKQLGANCLAKISLAFGVELFFSESNKLILCLL